MIRRPKSLENDLYEMDLTSLLDVIFILLVFLILVMGSQQTSTLVTLPKTDHPRSEADPSDRGLLIEIDHEGAFRLGEGEPMDFETFRHALLQRVGDKHAPLRLAADQEGPIGELLRLMSFLGEEGYQNLEVLQEWREK